MRRTAVIFALAALIIYGARAQTQTLSVGGIVNAASYAGGSVSPGEIVTIFGSFPGPAGLVTLQLDSRGYVATSLGSAQVLFDGVPAPMIYARAGQVAAIVPYAVSAKTSTQIQVSYQGQNSNAVSIPVAAVAPAIFTVNASGVGQGSILNQDGTVNSPTNPAGPGLFVSVFGTGEGQTNPPGIDGKPADSPAPTPVATPVTATVGGVNAKVQYAGGAPGLVAGVLQVNVQIPQNVTPGNAVPIVLTIGGKSTQTNVTLAVSASAAPRVLSVSPSSAGPGQSVAVQVAGLFTNYVQGSTQASFGPGISVGGAAQGGFGPVTVTGPTTATARLTIDPSAALGSRTVRVSTGAEQLMLVNKFMIGGVAATISMAGTVNVQNLPPPVSRAGQESDFNVIPPSIPESPGLPGPPVSTLTNATNAPGKGPAALQPRAPASGPLALVSQFNALNQFQGTPASIGNEPPDTQLAVGRTRLLEMVNNEGAFFDRAGNPVNKPFDLGAFFDSTRPGLGSDPRVLFDAMSNTYFATYLFLPPNAEIVLAVATDPGDTWTTYTIATNATTLFDQPRLGISNNLVMVSWELYNFDSQCMMTRVCQFLGEQYIVIDKSDLLSRASSPHNSTWGPDTGRFGIVPVTSLSPTGVQYAAYHDHNGTNLNIMAFSGVPDNIGVTFTDNSFDIGSTSDPPAALQPGGTTVWKNAPPRINNDDRLLSAVWQNDTLWGAFNESCGTPPRSCMRFLEVLTNNNFFQTNEQLGTQSQDFYYPAVSLTGGGDLVFGFTSSSITLLPTATVEGFGGGVFGNGTGQGLGYQPGSVAYTGVRWGDYSGAAREPDDLNRIWVAQEFASSSSPTAPSSIWATAVAQTCFSTSELAVQCPQPPTATGPTLTVSITETQTGPLVCFAGSGYAKNGSGSVTVTYQNVPGLHAAPLNLETDSSGKLGTPSDPAVDTQFDFAGLDQFCSSNQLQGNAPAGVVSITARDTVSNFQVQATVPAYFWCAQSLAQSYNGGCH